MTIVFLDNSRDDEEEEKIKPKPRPEYDLVFGYSSQLFFTYFTFFFIMLTTITKFLTEKFITFLFIV